MPAAELGMLRVRTRLLVETTALRHGCGRTSSAPRNSSPQRSAARERGEQACDPGLRLRVLAGAALATLTTALTAWITAPEHVVLPDLIDEAFAALEELPVTGSRAAPPGP